MRHVVLALGALALASCSLVFDADVPQCSTTQDCLGRGTAFAATTCVAARCVATTPTGDVADAGAASDGSSVATDAAADAGLDPFGCVGKVRWPAPTNEPIVEHATFAGFVDGRIVPGLTAQVCSRTDIDCSVPLATVVTDVNGKVDIPLTKGFLGYLQMVTAPDSLPGLMPMIVSYMPPIFADATTTKLVAGKRDVAALAAAVGQAIDESRGLLSVTVLDCDGQTAAGVQVELAKDDDKTATFYFQGGLPATGRTETDSTGSVVLGNVRPGIVSVTSKSARTGKMVGSQAALVRAGTLTVVYLPPTPL